MSEYAHSKESYIPVTAQGLLFDDTTFGTVLDHVVDTQGIPYHDARLMQDIPPDVEEYIHSKDAMSSTEVDLNEGASVNLHDRALAIKSILTAYGKVNKASGAMKALDKPDDSFNTRYKNPAVVAQVMESKGRRMKADTVKHFEVLNATKALKAEGFDEERVDRSQSNMSRDFENKYGPEVAMSNDRRKLLRKVSKTAERSALL